MFVYFLKKRITRFTRFIYLLFKNSYFNRGKKGSYENLNRSPIIIISSNPHSTSNRNLSNSLSNPPSPRIPKNRINPVLEQRMKQQNVSDPQISTQEGVMARRNEKGFHWQASKDEISLIYSPDEPFYRPPIGSKESFRAFVAFVSFIFFFYSPYPLLPRHLSFPNNGAIRFHQAINRGEGIKYSIGRIYIYTRFLSSSLPFLFFLSLQALILRLGGFVRATDIAQTHTRI